MSNFGQGFPNGTFDPSLLYNIQNGGNVGNVGNLGGAGNLGGTGNVDQNQIQGFNLGNLGVGGLGAGMGANTGVGGAGGGGSLPQGWINSFNSLQSQQQLDQRRQQTQNMGQAVPNANPMSLMGGAGNGNAQNDGQRQLDILRNMQAIRSGMPQAGQPQTPAQAMIAQQIQQQLVQQHQRQQQVQQQQQAQRQQQVAQQQQQPQQQQGQANQFANMGGAKPGDGNPNKDLSGASGSSGISQNTVNQYTQLLQKNPGMMTPEMQQAMRRLQQQSASPTVGNNPLGVDLGGNSSLMGNNALQQPGGLQGSLPQNQGGMTDQQRREALAKRLQLAQSGINLNNHAQIMAMARAQQQQRMAGGAGGGVNVNAANLAQLGNIFPSSQLNNLSPALQQQLFQQLSQAQQQHQQQAQQQAQQQQQQQQSQQTAQQPAQPQQSQQSQQPQTQQPQAQQQGTPQAQQPSQLPSTTQPPTQAPNQTPQQSTPTLPSAQPQAGQGLRLGPGVMGPVRQTFLPNEDEWMRILRNLHNKPNLQYPVVDGKTVNLFKLFGYVFSHGGYRFFDSQQPDKMWSLAAAAVGFGLAAPPGQNSAETVAKQISDIYHTYLSRFEELWQQNLANQQNRIQAAQAQAQAQQVAQQQQQQQQQQQGQQPGQQGLQSQAQTQPQQQQQPANPQTSGQPSLPQQQTPQQQQNAQNMANRLAGLTPQQQQLFQQQVQQAQAMQNQNQQNQQNQQQAQQPQPQQQPSQAQAQQSMQQSQQQQQPSQPQPQQGQQQQQQGPNQNQGQPPLRQNAPPSLSAEFINAVSQNPNIPMSEHQRQMMRAAQMQQIVQQAQQAQAQQQQAQQKAQQQQQQQQQQQTPQQPSQSLPTQQPPQQQQQPPQPSQQQQPGTPIQPPRTLNDLIHNIRAKEQELETAFMNTRKSPVQIPPEQAAEYQNVVEVVARLAQDAKQKNPLFNVLCASDTDKSRCTGLLQMSSIAAAAVIKARNNQPCLTLKELENVRNRLKDLLDQSNQHLTAAMTDPRMRMRMQMLAQSSGMAGAAANAANLNLASAAVAANAANATNANNAAPPANATPVNTAPPAPPPNASPVQPPAQPPQTQQQQQQQQQQFQQAQSTLTGTPIQHSSMLSPEVLNNLIKRPLKQEDLKPPPLPKARKQKVEPSPKPVEEKPPRTPAAAATTPAEASTPSTTTATTTKRPQKRKASTTTPKTTKKAKAEDTKPPTAPSPAVATPQTIVRTPQTTAEPAPPAPTSTASTPANTGFIGNTLNVSRSTHADYFAQQRKAAEAEREQSAQFFAARQGVSVFDGDMQAALNMWSDAQAGPSTGVQVPGLGDGGAPLSITAQTDDALADQSWHDYINEGNFDLDEPTPLLTRCRSLDTDPDCSPRDADIIGRSPLVSMVNAGGMHGGPMHMHGLPGMHGIPGVHDKFARRLPLMSPSAQPYNGMLFVDSDDGVGPLDAFLS